MEEPLFPLPLDQIMMPMVLISTTNTECCYVVGDVVIGVVISTYMMYHIRGSYIRKHT